MTPDPMLALQEYLKLTMPDGTRVWYAELPQEESEAMPRRNIVLSLTPGSDVGPGSRSHLPIDITVCSMRVYGENFWDAFGLYTAAHEQLKYMQRAVVKEALLHWAARLMTPVQLRDPVVAWPFVYATYRILVSEVAVA